MKKAVLLVIAIVATIEAAMWGTVWWRAGTVSPDGAPIILVSIDTLRADHVSAYGYARSTTPNLDRLAAQGVLFRRVISPSGWTLPAHASLFTGVLPSRHGATRSS